MARKTGDVQVQVVMPPELRKAIGKAALVHQDDVPRERLMDRGPMIAYVMRWFLTLPPSEQLNAILAGKAIEDKEKGLTSAIEADEAFARELIKGRTSLPKAPDDSILADIREVRSGDRVVGYAGRVVYDGTKPKGKNKTPKSD